MKTKPLVMLCLCLSLAAGIALVPPMDTQISAESVSELQKDLATKRSELEALRKKESEAKSEQSKNFQDQNKARDKNDEDELRRLKTVGDEIGTRLNSIGDSVAAKVDEISAINGKIRTRARTEVKSALDGAQGASAAAKIGEATSSLSSWSTAFSTFEIESHQQEHLPARATTDSKARANREKSRLERIIKAHELEESLLKDEQSTLEALSAKKLEDQTWKALKSKLDSLLGDVKSRAATVKKRLSEDRARIKVLENHVK